MLAITVGRRLTQRRSVNETRENVEYLANLPRSIGFTLEAIEVDDPAPEGLLWYYRGIIRYAPKKHEKPERIEKDRTIVLERVRRACQHKCWGRAPWQIEGEISSNGFNDLGSLSAQPAYPAESGLSTTPARDWAPLDLATLRKVWPDLVKKVGANLGWRLSQAEPVAAAGPDHLFFRAKAGYSSLADACGSPEALAKIEQCLRGLLNRPVTVKYERAPDIDDDTENKKKEPANSSPVSEVLRPGFVPELPNEDPIEAGSGLSTPSAHVDWPPLDLATVRKVWPNVIKKVGAALGWRLSQVEIVAVVDPDSLVIRAKPGYSSVADACGAPEAVAKIEQCLRGLLHRQVGIEYERAPDNHEELQNNENEPAEFSPLSDVARSVFVPELPNEDTIKEAAVKFDMISDPSRLKIVLILGQEERNVTELCSDLGSQSQPAISHHLSILRHARLIEPRRQGKHNYYELTDEGRKLSKVVEQVVD